jgi:hypothetical protein
MPVKKDKKREVTDALQEHFESFLQLVPASQFSKCIRRLLLSYIRNEVQTGVDGFLEEFIENLEVFFSFLDTIEEEYETY